ncbi:MAG: hypothetical protein A2X34_09970 [Elusimicrobia bacterium GWC2_51_8]|nr:MAG: hypothetical protein A2X33_06920 [Elusimicrobia bacterium GWA2_51_34]OGR58226.1 MAG: hypothetical protein A2X34_09970 [Elusimicrobia bacterium GWC2_51_8]OGR88579.1 MAG: hypothetical protein A2021_09915 [Elusimicrobia bacterium GWF2_52_66]HAF95459.1 glutaredoxin family protein [Elusimicrobiota bacterium]HCE98121.1 glutaredoxin family protein [Elusimicrobiota bacterium]
MRKKKVRVYALSTCGWCRKTVGWLKENNIAAEVIYTDVIEDEAEKEKVVACAKKYNPLLSFPTVVIDNGEHVIIGFAPEKIREALKK